VATTRLVKSADKSDGVVAVTKQYCLQTLSKRGQQGRRSTIDITCYDYDNEYEYDNTQYPLKVIRLQAHLIFDLESYFCTSAEENCL